MKSWLKKSICASVAFTVAFSPYFPATLHAEEVEYHANLTGEIPAEKTYSESPSPESSPSTESDYSDYYSYENMDHPLDTATSDPSSEDENVVIIHSNYTYAAPSYNYMDLSQKSVAQQTAQNVQAAAASTSYSSLIQAWFEQHQTIESQITGYHNLSQTEKDFVNYYIPICPVWDPPAPPIKDPWPPLPPYNPEDFCKNNPADARCSGNTEEPVNPEPPLPPNDPNHDPNEPKEPTYEPPLPPYDPNHDPNEPKEPTYEPPLPPYDPNHDPNKPEDPTYVVDPPYDPNHDPNEPEDPTYVVDPPYDPNHDPNKPEDPTYVVDPPYDPNHNENPVIDEPVYNPDEDKDPIEPTTPLVKDPDDKDQPTTPPVTNNDQVAILTTMGMGTGVTMGSHVISASVVISATISGLKPGFIVRAFVGPAFSGQGQVEVQMQCNSYGTCSGSLNNPSSFYPWGSYTYSVMVYGLDLKLVTSVTNKPLQLVLRDMTPTSTGVDVDTSTNTSPDTTDNTDGPQTPPLTTDEDTNDPVVSFPALPKTSWKEISSTVGYADTTYVDAIIKSANGTNNLLELTLTDPDINAKRVYSYNLNLPDVVQVVYFSTTRNTMSSETFNKNENTNYFADSLSRIIKHLEIPTHAPSLVTGQMFTSTSVATLKQIAEQMKPHILAEVKTSVRVGSMTIAYDSADPMKITTYTAQYNQWGTEVPNTRTNVVVYDGTGPLKTLFQSTVRDLISELERLANASTAQWEKSKYKATAEAVEVNALRIYPYTNWYQV
jgi:hypothetical protein